jgi:hypothetical protein
MELPNPGEPPRRADSSQIRPPTGRGKEKADVAEQGESRVTEPKRPKDESARNGIVKLTAVSDNRPMGSLYRRHRFPPEIISHAVWLYDRFTLSLRDVEDLLAERGITATRSTSSFPQSFRATQCRS